MCSRLSIAGTMTSMLKAITRPRATPAKRADHARGRALDDEDPHHRARARAEGAQDGDVGALVGDRHDQRRDQVERGDGDDQRQDDEHQSLFDLHRREPVAVGAGPVAHDDLRPEALLELGGDDRGAVQVLQAQLDAGRSFDAKQLGRVLERDQGQAAVVLVVAGVEGADDGERAQARHDPGRRDLAAGQDDRHLVALADRERARQLAAEDDAPRAGDEARQRRVAQLGGEVGDGRLFLRRDAADDDAAHVVAARDQRLRGNERRGADDLGILPRLVGDPAPVDEAGTAGVAQLDVGDHRQHPVAHFLLEAVHDRQDDDQRGDAEGDAEHRHAGDERDEAVPAPGPAGPRVAPADLQFIGPVHAGAMLPDGARHRGREGAPIIAACTCSYRSLPTRRRPVGTCCTTWRCRTSNACSACSRRPAATRPTRSASRRRTSARSPPRGAGTAATACCRSPPAPPPPTASPPATPPGRC